MDARRLLTLAAIPLVGVVACGERAAEEEAAEGGMAEGEMAGERAAGQAAEKTVDLTPKNDSGITGTAVIEETAGGDSLRVSLTLNGLAEGNQYPAHIHTGTCQQTGGVAVGLTGVTGQAGGSGTSTSTVAADALSADQSYYVQAHLPNGTPASCGNLPAPEGGSGGGQASSGQGGGY